MKQQTIKTALHLSGIGVHSGMAVDLRIKPAPDNHGIVFVRTDVEASKNTIKALYTNVSDTRLCTVISNEYGIKVSTIEHIMSAFYGLGIDNAVVEISAEEMPILDGSSVKFVEMIESIGLVGQPSNRKYIRILSDVVVGDATKFVKISNSEKTAFGCQIDFDHPVIGAQGFEFDSDSGDYKKDVSAARTFGFAKDIEALRKIGLARGGSLENAVGIDDNGVMNPEGLRYPNELARHKVLDMIGDLFLAGHRIIGKIDSYKPGHAINNSVLHKLFEDTTSFEIVEL